MLVYAHGSLLFTVRRLNIMLQQPLINYFNAIYTQLCIIKF
ncbi:hypothetical protein CLV42_102168 [Chitinophaga ginsengisoli]|uniref:Uncharacterized protein n=1 Tax=Chitinophaga ginsengisoli TaxID=363837 RepID=A0A2P8GKX0_9BACT|nr:hypothetical protein CLV42_102168 [Chitinophaga ginsengisoli]